MNTPTVPSSAPSWHALDEAAADAAVDPVTVLLQTAAIATGLASPESAWKGPAGIERPGLNLLVPAEGLLQQRLLAQQLDLPIRLQERLRKTSAQLRTELLEIARYGPNPNGPGGHHETFLSQQAQKRHADALHFTADRQDELLTNQMGTSMLHGQFRQDFTNSVVPIREEALVRPSVMLTNPGVPDLCRQAASSHLGQTLITGSLERLLNKPRPSRAKAMPLADKDLADYLDGFDSPLPHTGSMTPVNDQARLQASAILTTNDAELRHLLEKNPGLLNHFAIAASTGPPQPPARERPTGSEGLSQKFDNLIRDLISSRRVGEGLSFGMRDRNKARKFHRQQLGFLARVEQADFPVGGLAAVPVALAWTIACLYQGSDVDDLILKIAIPHAEVLLERHVATLEGLEEAHEAEEDLEHELAIVGRIRKHGPLSDRQLIRKFSVQRKDVHQPAIDRLLAEGVLVRDDQCRLSLGPGLDDFEKTASRQHAIA